MVAAEPSTARYLLATAKESRSVCATQIVAQAADALKQLVANPSIGILTARVTEYRPWSTQGDYWTRFLTRSRRSVTQKSLSGCEAATMVR
jgi:hypothetical protein